jgi:hypothetical protein
MRHLNRLLITIGVLVTPAHTLAQNGVFDGPLVFIDTAMPTQTGTTRTVCPSGCSHATLQAAINAAAPGDTIMLAPGSVHVGPITLTAKSNPNNLWIVIRSSSAAFNAGGALAPGTRVNPSNAASMAAIESPGSNARAIVTAAGANHYRLVGLEVRAGAAETNLGNLIVLGSDTSATPAASDITIDRSWVHGRGDAGSFKRGAAFNGASMAVIDSYFNEFHSTSGDSQAVAGWNGPGPFKIVNNYLEAQSENIMFGGAQPALNVIPSDIEIRRNVLSKPLAWRGVYAVKNAFETKNIRRAVIEGNIFENVWASGQDGHAISLKISDQSGACPWCSAVDIIFRYNIIRHSAAGLKVARDGTGDQLGDILIEHNLFEHIDSEDFDAGGNSYFMLLSHASSNIVVRNNTFLNDNDNATTNPNDQAPNPPNDGTLLGFTNTTMINGFEFSRNLGRRNAFGVKGQSTTEGITSIETFTTPGTATFERNGIAGCSLSRYDSPSYDNLCPSYATWEAQFENYSDDGDGGDYHLQCDSEDEGCIPNIYLSAWNEDIGADIDAILAAMGGEAPTPPAGTVVLEDNFNAAALDTSKWTANDLFSGDTVDPGIPVQQVNNRIEIGPLANQTGTHYNGIRSAVTHDMTAGYASVQVTQAVAGDADTMFSIGRNSSNYYRIWISNGQLACAREIGGVKGEIAAPVAYNSSIHQFLRIKHEAGNVVCEAAPAVGDAPGTWSPFGSEAWNTSAVPPANMYFEVKAGTSSAVPSAGSAYFDNFKAFRP